MSNCFIFDIGKTNIKCVLFDGNGHQLWSRSRPNIYGYDGDYPYVDVDAIWDWLLRSIELANEVATIEAINVSTHGACAVLLDKKGQLVLPVLDYEQPIPESISDEYNDIRPDFSDTFSPSLPLGLNLGRQLFWLKKRYATEFNHAKTLLMYPQYWVWKLTGKAITEVTSLGCHTDMWQPAQQRFSSLVDTLQIRGLMPPIKAAYDVIGQPRDEVCKQTKLTPNCQVFSGVHDSNAGFARYLHSLSNKPITLVSTGTWIISMTNEPRLKVLQQSKDTLANVSVSGQLLSCARFMGGREFEEICLLTHTDESAEYDIEDLWQLVIEDIFALPCFSQGGGPFAGQHGEIIGKPQSGKALASMYLALMIDYQLDLLGIVGDVVFGSMSKKNTLMCQVLAQLRPHQSILLSGDSAGTVKGAWCLTRWDNPPAHTLLNLDVAKATQIKGLAGYRDRWRNLSEMTNEIAC
ncbi:FGGY family carbohydrate kinase [Alteromonadaceae bacterium BrNp21-10]|nr:FGGY family carbohydrate kinase [Alteromonadaceae bacterium BrNp21-10]